MWSESKANDLGDFAVGIVKELWPEFIENSSA